METVALYIGYLIIWLIVVLLLGLSLCVMCSTILGLYRIIKYKHIFRLLKRYETRSIYKTSKAATQFLISIGISPENTLKEALAIFRTFRIGFTNEERRTLQIASESLTGNSRFYQQIGIDTDFMIMKSKEIITEKYFSNEKIN